MDRVTAQAGGGEAWVQETLVYSYKEIDALADAGFISDGVGEILRKLTYDDQNDIQTNGIDISHKEIIRDKILAAFILAGYNPRV